MSKVPDTTAVHDSASRDWQVDGSLIYRLVRNGDFRRGSPVVVNEFTIRVQTGYGTTVADATLLAQGIADLLNADTKYRAKEPA